MRHHTLRAAFLAMVMAVTPASRADVPLTLAHHGFLTDADGKPVTATLPFTFNVYASDAGTDLVWGETISSLSVDGGFYAATLGLSNTLKDVFNTHTDLWLEVVVDGEKITPRQKISAVPYAIVAGDAVGDIHPTSISVNGAIVIGKDGTWAGDPAGVPGVKSVTAAAPLTGGTITDTGTVGIAKAGAAADGYLSMEDFAAFNAKQSRVIGICDAGYCAVAVNIDGTLVCSPCGAGGAGSGTVTSVGTGPGLAGGPITAAGTLSLDGAWLDGSAHDARFVNEGQANAVTGAMIAAGAVTLDKLAQSACAGGQIAKWNGTAWACAPDLVNVYTAGPGITVTGTVVSLNETGCAAFQILKRNAGNNGWDCVPDDDTKYTAGAGLALNGTQFSLPSTCQPNTVLKWTGVTWTCADYAPAAGGVQSVTATLPLLSTGGNTPNISVSKANATTDGYVSAGDWAAFNVKQSRVTGFCPNGSYMRIVNADGTVTCDTDLNTAYSPDTGSGLVLTGTKFSLLKTCAAGNVLKWDGTQWDCAADDTGGGGGTVTSVGLAMPAQFTVSGSPVTASGSLTAAWATQGANLALAGPATGAAAAPTFRALTDADIPDTITASGYSPTTHNHAGTYEPAVAAGTTSQYWRGDKSWQTLNTTAVAEGSNLYYTDARARAAIAGSAPISYSSATGVVSLGSSYVDGSTYDGRFVNEGQSGSVTSAMIVDGTIAFADWSQNACTPNQIPKWNGGAWACADDSGGTTYTGGTGISVTGATIAVKTAAFNCATAGEALKSINIDTGAYTCQGNAGGGVTDVTATAPLASSGGALPNISLTGAVPIANGGTGTSTAFTQGSILLAGVSGVYTTDPTNLFWDDTNNRLGVGTATPSTALQVVGTARASGFSTADGTAGTPTYRFENDANTGMYLGGADTLAFSTGGTERARVDVSGVAVAAGVTWGGTSSLSTDQGGSIELGDSAAAAGTKSPFIDFHYAKGAAQDYNARLINDADGQLSVMGNLNVTGALKGATNNYGENDSAVNNTSNSAYVNATTVNLAAGDYLIWASVESYCNACYCQSRLRNTTDNTTIGGDNYMYDGGSAMYAGASWVKKVSLGAAKTFAIQQKIEAGSSGTCTTRNARIFALRVGP